MNMQTWANAALVLALVVMVVLVVTVTMSAMGYGRVRPWPSLPRRARREPPPGPTFAYASPAGEKAAPPWHKEAPYGPAVLVTTRHMRQLGPEGINPAGGPSGATLCGVDLEGGNPEAPEVEAGLVWPQPGQVMIEPCYHCEAVREQAGQDHYVEHVQPLLTRREQRYYDEILARSKHGRRRQHLR